jgi:hypothetical protein
MRVVGLRCESGAIQHCDTGSSVRKKARGYTGDWRVRLEGCRSQRCTNQMPRKEQAAGEKP